MRQSRSRNPIAAMLAACLLPGPVAAAQDVAPRDDRLAAYLESHGLDALLAHHLRGVLEETADPPQRVAIAERLGRLYADRFAAAKTSDERTLIASLASSLLAQVPESDAFDLRLTIARATYAHAEQIAERDRLRLASTEERGEAAAAFASIEPELEAMGEHAAGRVQALDAELRRPLSPDAVAAMRELLAEQRRRRSLAMYYAGWSSYYRAMLSGRGELALRAERLLGYVLNAEGQTPTLDRLPEALLRYEHVARAAVGVALCRSLRGDHVDAVLWLDEVAADPDLPDEVRRQLPQRRIAVLGAAGRWDKLRRELADPPAPAPGVDPAHAVAPSPPPRTLGIADARLLAAVILESDDDPNDPSRTALLELALSSLVRAGEIGHVLDLVDRYGTLPLGSDGFIRQYARGVSAYNDARAAHAADSDAERPAADPSVRNAYLLAESALEGACAARDAREYDERAQAALLRGLATFYRGEPEAAADWLERSLPSLDGPDAREATWLAIAFLDAAGPAHAERVSALAGRFVQSGPSDPRAATLLLRATGAAGVNDDQAVAVLSAVPETSPLYLPARRQASQILYRLYRAAPPADRAARGAALLALGAALLDAEQASTDDAAPARALGLTRQLLDVALGMQPPRTDTADALITHAERLLATHDDKIVRDEISFRRLQASLARQDPQTADAIARDLALRGGPYAIIAARAIFAAASEAAGSTPGDPAAAQRVVDMGLRLLAMLREGRTEAAMDRDAAAIADRTAAAAQVLADSGDQGMREIALRLDREQIDAGAPTRAALHRYATLSEQTPDFAEAVRAWRFLSSALEPPDPAWFESRAGLIRCLTQTDPAAARRVLDQHRVLYPDLGPDPWGDRIGRLAAHLDAVNPDDEGTPP